MSFSENRIPFAKSNKTGRIVSVFEVERGLACGCVCPECLNPVEACKGPKRFYFRHGKSSIGNRPCDNPGESALHEAAKQIFKESTEIWLPKMEIYCGNQVSSIMIKGETVFQIQEVNIEKQQQSIRPDITISNGNDQLNIEIFVTHKVDEKKTAKLAENNIPTLEIDLSGLIDQDQISMEELKEILLGKNDHKQWVFFNRKAHQFEERLRKARKQYSRSEGYYYVVYDCPFDRGGAISDNKMHEESCGDCIFCADIVRDEYGQGGYICCTADLGVSLKDPAMPPDAVREMIRKEQEKRHERQEKQKSTVSNYQPRENDKPAVTVFDERESDDKDYWDTEYYRNELLIQEAKRQEDDRKWIAEQIKIPNQWAVDSKGRRWFQCNTCGKIGTAGEFGTYKWNRGTCEDCCHKGKISLAKPASPQITQETKRSYRENTCPECGAKLVRRHGKYGDFLGCSNYPKCRHSRKI